MFSVDWTPISYNYQSQAIDVSAHRFRILAHVLFEKHVAPKLTFSARAGGGIDIAHASADATILGTTFHASDTDVGSAFELGGGVWFNARRRSQIGGEVALPFGGHSHKASNNNDITFDYTSYDIDLLFGVRLRSVATAQRAWRPVGRPRSSSSTSLGSGNQRSSSKSVGARRLLDRRACANSSASPAMMRLRLVEVARQRPLGLGRVARAVLHLAGAIRDVGEPHHRAPRCARRWRHSPVSGSKR